jgi:phosphomannomutase
VVITASHNPPADNGYKVYDGNSAQIIPPTDVEIADAISRVGPAMEVGRVEGVFSGASPLVSPMPEDIFEAYAGEVGAARPNPQVSNLRIVYTPLHGVGGDTLLRMCLSAQHSGLIPVTEQSLPDGAFPTVEFPNPEEPGALDLALDLAREVGADLLLANDPDADRLAVAVPVRGDWRLLSGNELGALLGDYVLRYWDQPEPPIVVNSVVSSPMLGRIAARRGAVHETTLTGFKWIINAGLAMEERGDGRFGTKTGSPRPSSWPTSPPRRPTHAAGSSTVSTTCGKRWASGSAPSIRSPAPVPRGWPSYSRQWTGWERGRRMLWAASRSPG